MARNKPAEHRGETLPEHQDRIPLAGLLAIISSELRAAHESAMRDGHPLMRFQECELEFAVEAESNAGGGVQVYVLKLEGGVKRTETNTIKIKYVALDGSDPAQHTVAPLQAPEGARDEPKRQPRKEK